MSNPRFVPKNYAIEPDAFGRARTIAWVQRVRSNDERDRVEAAKLQHHFAVLIRRRAREKYRSMTAYAKHCDMPYDRLSKVMRGEVIMRFEDLAQAERILGGIVTGNDPFNPNIAGDRAVD